MRCPVCSECEKDLPNWSGNIMVDNREYPKLINEIRIICKECTNKMDNKGTGKRYHNIWELSWVKNNYFHLLGDILNDLMENGKNSRWKYDAVNQLWKLGLLVYDADPRDPISSSLSDI